MIWRTPRIPPLLAVRIPEATAPTRVIYRMDDH